MGEDKLAQIVSQDSDCIAASIRPCRTECVDCAEINRPDCSRACHDRAAVTDLVFSEFSL